MNIKLRDEYLIKRRKKRISQKELSEYLQCSQSLLSRYERAECGMSKEKVELYRRYIDEK
ncbi:helix-turn-helix transcriptional regulator [Anoxybacillus flavithermus]|uniref:helix-turn-helix domain-containing protein n=1 Tax=Anoxybacillus flavithermus TaxID=33934 RepID=UPI00186851EC|nr:helix-turn-helix transcriptional regulator [Anoxybacillus flavithermus]MBE2932356.1 helix-turn-helix transcriptional regulator [Anoxybacillus flavithermus]